jgi:hypothetical protein
MRRGAVGEHIAQQHHVVRHAERRQQQHDAEASAILAAA